MSFAPLILGHRGASVEQADNSIAAFDAAVAVGADGVELDVRRTADRQLPLSHDPALADGRRIVDLAAADLPVDIALLPAGLDACRALRVVNIEIKNLPGEPDFDATEWVAEAVVELLDGRGELGDGRIVLSSFHRPTIDRVHRLAPGVATGWLLVDGRALDRRIAEAAEAGHRAVHPHHVFVTEELVAMAHEAGLAVNTWTCDDPDRLRWLAAAGVDSIVANDPAAALRALGR